VGYLIGALVGSIFSMIGDILSFFAPKTESMAQQIRTLLEDQDVDRVQSDIRAVHRSFLNYASTLGDQCASIVDPKTGLDSPYFQPAVAAQVIEKLNLVDGVSMSTYWKVIDWLANPKHQNLREWPLILDAACNAYSLLLVAVVRITSLVNSERIFKRYREADENGRKELHGLWVAATAQLRIYGSSQRMDLEQLRRLSPAVQNRGTLWRITRNFEVGVIDPKVSPVHHGGGFEFKKMSVTVCSLDQTKPEPVYQLYGIEMTDQLVLWKVVSYRTGEKKVADWVDSSNYLNARQLNDVFATPGTDLSKPNHARVYELSTGNTITGKYRDADGKETETFCRFTLPADKPDLMAVLTSVRAVHDPYAYADDPANGYLKGINYLVYATGEPSGPFHPERVNRILLLQNGGDPRFVHGPQFIASGIAVDQDYLWVFSSREFACATHASMVRMAKTGDVPAWITCTNMPEGKSIHAVYPCDDGTIVAIVKDTFEVYSAPYRIDLKKHAITAYDSNNPFTWTKIGDCRAQGLEKLPVFCWPQFESLRETLESLQGLFAPRGATAN
jgi:hypothetical protein